jgi:hypothetical protein
MTPAARDAAQDVALALRLTSEVATWREIAQQAIHQLAAAHVEHTALQRRYYRLLDENRTP